MELVAVGFGDLPDWTSDHQAAALAAFVAGCAALPSQTSLGGQGIAESLGGTPAAWAGACAIARRTPVADDAAARAFFESVFQPYAITDMTGRPGLFTGYYEPEVNGSRLASATYHVPLFARPADLVEADLGAFADDLKTRKVVGRVMAGRFVPYFDRAAITAGALAGRGLELAWLADPVDAFFLEIQGSGRIRLPDGTVLRVTYDGQNGHRYVPIGRVIAPLADVPASSMTLPAIRDWLSAHPSEAAGVMNANPSYVFFRLMPGLASDAGPPGALGAPLSPGRSAAVDRAFIPLGAPLYVDTTDPLDGVPLRRVVIAQDVGGAIKGPVRADVFWGWGEAAERRAGLMRAPGSAYVLLPRAGRVAAAD